MDPGGLEGRSVSAQYWPRWIEPFVPGYGNYGGPMRTDPSFSTKPVDSMDRLFMQHDIGWARGQGRQADKTVIEGLYNLPSNPMDWTEQPKSSWQATGYRRLVAEPYFWWRNRDE